MFEDLKAHVCKANKDLARHQLVTLTFGNVSGIAREHGLVAIKPSGVSYEELTPDDIVVVDMDGNVVEGRLRPSSDTPTHLLLYKAFGGIGGITHTHSAFAAMFAQAVRGIPCLGTTHADHFYGQVPVTRPLSQEEVEGDYEMNVGRVIVERFEKLDPREMPAVLVANHGPFTWGTDAADSVRNGVLLEQVARTAFGTLSLDKTASPIPQFLLDKHFLRKHGPEAYYGQPDGERRMQNAE